jgi:hypothetical protein
MSLQAWGNVFGAFAGVEGYDKLVHFLLPCAASALLYLALVRVRVVPDLAEEAGVRHRPAILLVTAALGLAMMGGLYEVYEWFADHALGAHLHVSYGDSIGDLLADLAGALAGGCLILVWEARGWGTRRRPNPPAGGEPREDPVAELGDRAVAHLRPDAPGREPRRGPGLPRPLVGDWPGPLRDPLDLLRLTFLVGLGVAIGAAEWEAALRFALSFAAAVAVRRLDAPRPFDLLFLAALGMQAWGTLAGVFGSVGGFDSATHVVVSAAVGPILYIAVVRSRLLPELSRRTTLHQATAIVLVVFSLGYSAGILYDLYAYLADHLLGATIVSDYALFVGRLALDIAGSLVGAALVACWGLGEWPLRRAGGGDPP